jgi:riboflavin biosynthesis pyrimidine reductase
VAANFVMSADGRFADSAGSSRGISNSRDLQHLVHLRRQCDALVTDGKTARLENYAAKPSLETYVFTRKKPAEGLHALRAESAAEFDVGLATLRLHHSRILLETGPTILKTLISRRLVNRLFLSITGDADERAAGVQKAQALLGFNQEPAKVALEPELNLYRFDFS